MLPGDLLRQLLKRWSGTNTPPGDRDRGSLDPQTIAEFLEYDVPFDTPPAQGFVFPSEAEGE